MSAISDDFITLRQISGWAGKHIDELMEPINQTQKNAQTMFQRFFAEMREKIDELLSKKTKQTELNSSKNKVTRKQMAEEPPEGGVLENRSPKTVHITSKKFKKKHLDGNINEDPYTLMPDGKPMGAKVGAMPSEFKGLKKPPADYDKLRAEGYPDITTREDFANFSTIEAKELPPGTKIYRIIDEGSSEMSRGNSGCYWAKELPKNKTEWRRTYAVKDSWNDNGYYVEHTVGPDGLKVWEGKTAGQRYEVHNGKKFYLEGGETQLYVDYGRIDNLQPKLTNWPDV